MTWSIYNVYMLKLSLIDYRFHKFFPIAMITITKNLTLHTTRSKPISLHTTVFYLVIICLKFYYNFLADECLSVSYNKTLLKYLLTVFTVEDCVVSRRYVI